MADCWWGIAEREEKSYDFSAYSQLTQMASDAGLKIQYVMSFHQVRSLIIEYYLSSNTFNDSTQYRDCLHT